MLHVYYVATLAEDVEHIAATPGAAGAALCVKRADALRLFGAEAAAACGVCARPVRAHMAAADAYDACIQTDCPVPHFVPRWNGLRACPACLLDADLDNLANGRLFYDLDKINGKLATEAARDPRVYRDRFTICMARNTAAHLGHDPCRFCGQSVASHLDLGPVGTPVMGLQPLAGDPEPEHAHENDNLSRSASLASPDTSVSVPPTPTHASPRTSIARYHVQTHVHALSLPNPSLVEPQQHK
jgi:hypothetical protein